jgi:hypothetical protein
MYHQVEKGTCLCRNMVPAEHGSCKKEFLEKYKFKEYFVAGQK